MNAWANAVAALGCATCVTAVPLSEPNSPKAIRLQVLEDPKGSAVSMKAVNSYPTSGATVEVSLDLKEEPLEVTAPKNWRHAVSQESGCGWNVLWSRDREGDIDEDSEVWIEGFTAKLASSIGAEPVWCRYSVTFKDGTSAGEFAHSIH